MYIVTLVGRSSFLRFIVYTQHMRFKLSPY